MKLFVIITFLIQISFGFKLVAQRELRLLFYNTENLFDTENDPKTNDDEFTPTGNMHWTSKRYQTKLLNIYKVITAAGEWTLPDIIGFCEVENKKVLTDLIQNTPLASASYKIVHYNSPDLRGIDVALMYQSSRLKLLESRPVPVTFPQKFEDNKTRDILYTKFSFNTTDTFYVFVNHWPSRRGGNTESIDFRCFAAKSLKNVTDSLFRKNAKSKIVILGDFNDEPTDASLTKCLMADLPATRISFNKLYNVSSGFIKQYKTGTHKFQGQWLIFDQIIVSGGLLQNSKGLTTTINSSKVFNPPFLLFADSKYLGFKPNRTYVGMKYTGGFSDHLPVFIDLLIKK